MDTFERIDCRICGVSCKQISTSHAKMHGLTVKEYRDRFPDAPIVSSMLIENKRQSVKKYYRENPTKGAEHAEKVKSFWADPLNMERMKESFKKRPPQTEQTVKKISLAHKQRYANGMHHLRILNETDNMGNRENPLVKLGRSCEKSSTEEFVWNLLRPYGFKFNFPIASALSRKRYFYIDFALPSLKLAIELDSEFHHKSDVVGCDRRKNQALLSLGWTVFRIEFNSRSRRRFSKIQQEVLGILMQYDLETCNES